jgi:hypothetical protein
MNVSIGTNAADHAELADVIFDAVRNGPSFYSAV